MQNKIIVVITSLLVVSGFLFISKADDNCINVYVDYSSLDNGAKITKCIDMPNNTIALDVLKKSNLKIEGTKKYGMAVVCRVNGLPNKEVESCESMPPEKAYWAIIIKEKKIIPFPKSEWGWGQLAVNQQTLNPGDSIGLVWANNGKVIFP